MWVCLGLSCLRACVLPVPGYLFLSLGWGIFQPSFSQIHLESPLSFSFWDPYNMNVGMPGYVGMLILFLMSLKLLLLFWFFFLLFWLCDFHYSIFQITYILLCHLVCYLFFLMCFFISAIASFIADWSFLIFSNYLLKYSVYNNPFP